MKTKVNEVPLTGPRGRKELLKRINELEAQVAQQDHLYIEVSELGMDEIGSIVEEIWPVLETKFKAGTLQDAIFHNDKGEFGKILGIQVEEGELFKVSYMAYGDILGLQP